MSKGVRDRERESVCVSVCERESACQRERKERVCVHERRENECVFETVSERQRENV